MSYKYVIVKNFKTNFLPELFLIKSMSHPTILIPNLPLAIQGAEIRWMGLEPFFHLSTRT